MSIQYHEADGHKLALMATTLEDFSCSSRKIIDSQNQRITEWFGLEETFKDQLVQHTCHGEGYLPLEHDAQSSIQPGLEPLQWWDIYNLSGQLVPEFHCPHCKKFLAYIQSKSILFQLKTTAFCSVTTGPSKKSHSQCFL